MKVTVEGVVQSVEKAAGNQPAKMYLLQASGMGRPAIAEVSFWPAVGDRPGSIQKPGEVGKPVKVTGVARGNKYGVTVTAD